MNIYDYVKKYGEKTFDEMPFNDIDNLVFSELSYLNYSDTSINIRRYSLQYIGNEYLKTHFYSDVKKLGIAQRDAYLLLEEVIKYKRYKNVVVYDYVYSTSINKQFCALTFVINDNLEYICFEGTDELISGWKEDLYLMCVFPIPSQRDAINYAKKHIKLFGPNIIMGGHSKGGNLALVAGMYINVFKQFRLLKVYNNDGPGLRTKEFESSEYRRIKRKYMHIIPQCSIVGIFLKHDVYNVVKSSKNNIFGHAIATWQIEDDKLVNSTLSEKSKKIESNVIKWNNKHTTFEKEKIVTELFKAAEDANIKSLVEMSNLPKLIKFIENIVSIDKETKDLFISLVSETIMNNRHSE